MLGHILKTAVQKQKIINRLLSFTEGPAPGRKRQPPIDAVAEEVFRHLIVSDVTARYWSR